MSKPVCRTQFRTPEFDDEDYVESVLSKNYVGELEKNRVLDRNIEKEKEARIMLYTERLEQGLQIFNGEPLSDVDLCAVRGYGGISLGSAMNRIRHEDKLNYELDHDA